MSKKNLLSPPRRKKASKEVKTKWRALLSPDIKKSFFDLLRRLCSTRKVNLFDFGISLNFKLWKRNKVKSQSLTVQKLSRSNENTYIEYFAFPLNIKQKIPSIKNNGRLTRIIEYIVYG